MKRLAILLVAVGWLLWARPVSAQVAYTTHTAAGKNVGAGSTVAATITNQSAGNMNVVGVLWCETAGCADPTGDTISVTDTSLNSCTLDKRLNSLTTAIALTIFRCSNIATSASNVVTATISGTPFYAWISVSEYSGAASSPKDQTGQTDISSSVTSPISVTSSASTAQPNELIYALYNNLNSLSAGSGYSALNNDGGTSADEYRIVTAPSTYTATMTYAGSSRQQSIMVTYKAAVSGFAIQSGGQIISAPMLPQVTPSVVYPSEAGYTITPVSSGANLQTAITAAACGTILSLAHNGSWSTASAYTLPNTACACHTDPTKWVILRSDSYVGGSTRGARIDPSVEYTSLAHIVSTDANYAFSALANGASCYWFLGVDVMEKSNNATAGITFGDGSQTAANFPHDFVIDHSYIHDFPTFNTSRCSRWNGNFIAAVDSYIADCHNVGGADSQGILISDGDGFLIKNNTISGATEVIMSGGVGNQALQSDLTVQGNYLFKPLAWRTGDPTYAGIQWSVKDCFELKIMQRVLFTGNVCDTSWYLGQYELQIFNPGCSGATPSADSVQDVTEYYNIFRNSPEAMVYGGCADTVTFQPHRILFHDNLWYGIDGCVWGPCLSFNGILVNSGAFGSPLPPLATNDIWHIHETYSMNLANDQFGLLFGANPGTISYGMQLKDSIVGCGSVGCLSGTSQGAGGDPIIANFATNGNFKNDCLYGSFSGATYNNAAFSGVKNPANAAAVFVNPGVDFHVSGSSICHNAASDGTDMGANIDLVNSATSGVVQTLANLHTVTNVSPSTFTNAGGTTITLTGTNFISGEAQVIIGGAGPAVAISTDSCGIGGGFQGQFTVTAHTDSTHFTYTGGCVTVTSAPITLAVNDTISITNSGNVFRYSPGNLCTSPSVSNSTTMTCVTPAASGPVATGPVGVLLTQFGTPVQSTVFGNYN